VDEARTLQSAHSIAPDLDRIVRQHPRSALIVQTTHSLQDWHRASRDLTDSMVAFRLRGRSLESFLEYCDGSDEMRTAIENLPRHYAIAVDMGAGPDDAEFRYIEPRSWWTEKKSKNNLDNNTVDPVKGSHHAKNSRETAFEPSEDGESVAGRREEAPKENG
jgi:hypothetical protein